MRIKSLSALAAASVLISASASIPIAYAQVQAGATAPLAHPNLSGVWDKGGGVHPIRDAQGNVCVTWCTKESIPANRDPNNHKTPDFPEYKPELKARVAELNLGQHRLDPALKCINPGLPRIGPPAKIVQTSGQTVFLYDDENGSFWRIIPTDGRPHRSDAEDSFLGDAIGHWEGPVFVVESDHFNDISWLIDNGAFHTDKMKVVERFWKIGDTLHYQAIVDDPDVLAKPWVRKERTLKPSPKELLETPACVEQSLDKEVGDGPDTYHTNTR